MKKYEAIIFDLFNTIITFNFNHLPSIDVKGIRSRTTGKEVYGVFKEYHPEITFDEFYQPFIDSYHEFQLMKQKEFKEFPNSDRFKLMLRKMNLENCPRSTELADKMVLSHMNGLVSCVEFPRSNKDTLDIIANRDYRLALVSNFDYSPTAQMLIDKYDLRKYFEAIVISEDVGWRKPKDIIFNHVLSKLSIEPGKCLFIGDNFHADIVGSKGVGMDSVWINRKTASREELQPMPEFIIYDLPELLNIL